MIFDGDRNKFAYCAKTPEWALSCCYCMWRIGWNQPQAKEKGALRRRGGLTRTHMGESQAEETTVWGTPLKGDINRLGLLVRSQISTPDIFPGRKGGCPTCQWHKRIMCIKTLTMRTFFCLSWTLWFSQPLHINTQHRHIHQTHSHAPPLHHPPPAWFPLPPSPRQHKMPQRWCHPLS